MENLIQKLKTHDWFYMYSDDHRSFTKGNGELHDLKALMIELGLDSKTKQGLFNQYCPEPLNKFVLDAWKGVLNE